jgi:hypothetical protein
MYNHSTMFLRRDRGRWWAIVLLAAIAFTQVSLAFSDCQLDRTALLATMRSSTSDPCDHGGLVAKNWIKFENRCFAHCTADLQTVGHAVALLRSPADAPVLALVPSKPLSLARIAFDAPQPGAPPPRILFRSFLI